MDTSADKLIEQRVRERAYAIWESEGRPQGRHREHWWRAEREILAELSPPAAVRPAPRRRAAGSARPPAAKPPARRPVRGKAPAK